MRKDIQRIGEALQTQLERINATADKAMVLAYNLDDDYESRKNEVLSSQLSDIACDLSYLIGKLEGVLN